MFAVQPSADRVMVGTVLPVDWVNVTPPAPIAAEYLTESAKYASSAVTRFRRSDFIEARYAFSFVLANFGIAIAAKMPMITTTIRSSINVKPLRFIWDYLPCEFRTRTTLFRPTTSTNHALDGKRQHNRYATNNLRVRKWISDPFKRLRNSGFLQAVTPDARRQQLTAEIGDTTSARLRIACSPNPRLQSRWPRGGEPVRVKTSRAMSCARLRAIASLDRSTGPRRRCHRCRSRRWRSRHSGNGH